MLDGLEKKEVLLGPTLVDLFRICGYRFSLKTILMLVDQLIDGIQYIHERFVLHRDLKPKNFLIWIGPKSKLAHIIDYGLVKRLDIPLLRSEKFPCRKRKGFYGTGRYASISSHNGIEQTARDDMMSLGYVLMYFLRGSLP